MRSCGAACLWFLAYNALASKHHCPLNECAGVANAGPHCEACLRNLPGAQCSHKQLDQYCWYPSNEEKPKGLDAAHQDLSDPRLLQSHPCVQSNPVLAVCFKKKEIKNSCFFGAGCDTNTGELASSGTYAACQHVGVCTSCFPTSKCGTLPAPMYVSGSLSCTANTFLAHYLVGNKCREKAQSGVY
jgi:hypothetical protein